MKYVMLILLILTAFCSTSQPLLQPNGSGLFCTDEEGVRELARLLKELEFSRSELILYEDLLQASEQEADVYQKLLSNADTANQNLQIQNHNLVAKNDQLRKERWWFAGSGGAAVLLLFLLL